jgi:hypothetical protein
MACVLRYGYLILGFLGLVPSLSRACQGSDRDYVALWKEMHGLYLF